ncbi:sensor histidine kinase [Salinicoccus siamensis]|uniref:Heme sensor protein HssS n=1 Tax=Salinicoccus siamensis TaxID=381830 RepID=A0ABV5Z652_9STAP
MKQSLNRKFIIGLVIVIALSALTALLVANILYMLHSKPKMDQALVDTAETFVAGLEKADMTGAAIDEHLELFTALGYQGALIKREDVEAKDSEVVDFDTAAVTSAGDPFDRTELSLAIVRDVMDGGVYQGEAATLANWFMMGHFMNDVRNTVGVPLEIEGDQYALFIKQDSALMFSEFHIIGLVFFLTVFIVGLISIIIMSRRMTTVLGRLSTAADEIRRENFDYAIEPEHYAPDEIGQLAVSLDAMQGQLSENRYMRQKFISDVTHDLQSPLLNIQGYSKLMMDQDLPEGLRQPAEVVHQEARRLSALAKQLTVLNHFDDQTYQVKHEAIRLDRQVQEVIRAFSWRLDQEQIDLSYTLDEVTVKSDPHLLYNVWDNLVSNAIKYSEPGGEIFIRLIDAGDRVKVIFSDTGTGIRAEDMDQLFERFYRVDQSRSTNGSGLGLAIVKETLDMLGGKVEVESEFGSGTTFTITLRK